MFSGEVMSSTPRRQSEVSIPDRVLGVFRQLAHTVPTVESAVSIPDRVLGVFRRIQCPCEDYNNRFNP